MYDYHMHTSFSADSTASMEEMIESAIKKGFKEIAITDHIDYDYPDLQIDFSLDFENYHNALEKNAQKYKNQIRVVKGLEMGIQKHILNECMAAANEYPYDFIIASVHAAEKKDLDTGAYFENKSPYQSYIDYYTYVYDCLKEFKDYSVTGHLSLIDRYKKYISEPVAYNVYSDIVEEIFKLIINDGKGIELNASCYRYNTEELMPSIEMLKLYKELSGEIITVGSDAHSPEYIGYKFDYIYDLLSNIGFKYIATFNNMKVDFVKL
ncbi:MAG: histidinol-phosphatase HisJ family protein [Clostridiales bacterium]|nr:histidinol-phosphatase HisJ family protein [Clostridiales bacterium]